MRNSLRSLLFVAAFAGPILGLPFVLFADKQGDAEAEQHRLDSLRQEQNIENNKIEQAHQDAKRIDQDNINKKLEQKRLDDARQQRKNNIARWDHDHSRE